MNEQNNNPFNIPTERIYLPSEGVLYSPDNPLSEGYVEITYPTAKHEDILTNINYVEKGIAQEKFLEALIVSKINYKDLLQGDKDAIMVAARILGFGKDYSFLRGGTKFTVDLTTLKDKKIGVNVTSKGKNEFDFTLPVGKATITYKYLTLADEDMMDKEEVSMKKIMPSYSGNSTLFLRYSIIAVNGKKDKAEINKLSENMLLQDSKAFKKHYLETRPGIDFVTTAVSDTGEVWEDFRVPITLDFFWPS